MKRIGTAVVLAYALGLLCSPAALAKTTTVSCTGLQTALNTAANGDVIKLDQLCVGQSFTITNTSAFTLEGVGDAKGAPLSGFNGGVPILRANADVTLTITNLLFENGNNGFAGGSAIDISGVNDSAKITHNLFITNTATGGYGGAVSIESSAVKPTVITGNVFKNNSAADGGAIYFFGPAPLQLIRNTFTGNSQDGSASSYYGGAVDIEAHGGSPPPSTQGWSGAPITISGNTFGGTAAGAGNSGTNWGGALFVSVQGGEGSGEPAQRVTLTNNRFIHNEITGTVAGDHVGGAVAFDLEVRQFPFNVVQSGNLFHGNMVGGTTSGNTAGGGAEWSTGVSIKSTRDSFTGNRVIVTDASPAPQGGAVGMLGFNQNVNASSTTTAISPTFTGADDLFSQNSIPGPTGWGGAIYTGGAAGNDCNDATCPPSHLILQDSTLTGNSVNSASGSGAAIWGGSHDSLSIVNSIVFGNKGAAHAAEIFGYAKPKYSHDDACTTAGGKKPLQGPGDICANPKLGVIGSESATSPTIDRGSNALVPKGVKTDLLGKPRITEGRPTTCKAIVDMGAYESKAVKPAKSCVLPVEVKPPHITGTPKVGHTLRCEKGSWSHHPTRYRYAWKRSGKTIHGATKSTYTVQAADKGHALTCTVWAVNKHGTSKPATSAPVHVT